MINFEMLYWGLEELASVEMQTKLWLGNCDCEMSTFEEAVCHVFDDSGLGSELDSSEKRRMHEQAFLDLADNLSKAIHRLNLQKLAPLELIHTKDMETVRNLSQSFLDYILKRKMYQPC